jgi:small subunit ribosomal protein S4
VNGRKVNIPSFQVSVGDVVAIRENAKKLVIIEAAGQYAQQNHSPSWLEIDYTAMSGKIVSLPKRDEISLPVNEQLIVELYSK